MEEAAWTFGDWIFFAVVFGFIAWVVIMGCWSAYRSRNDGKFQLLFEKDGTVTLNYGWRGEWIEDSVHETEEAARKKIDHYRFKGAEGAIRRGL